MGESNWTEPESWRTSGTLRQRNSGHIVRENARTSLLGEGGLSPSQPRVVRSTLDLEKALPQLPTSSGTPSVDGKPTLPPLQPVRAATNTELFPESSSAHPLRQSPSYSGTCSPRACFIRRRAASSEQLSKLVETIRGIRVRRPACSPGKGDCHFRKWIARSRSATDSPLFSSSHESRNLGSRGGMAAAQIDIAFTKVGDKPEFDPVKLYDGESCVGDNDKDDAVEALQEDDELLPDDQTRRSYTSDGYESSEDDMDSDSESTCSSFTSSESVPIVARAIKTTALRPLPYIPTTLSPKQTIKSRSSSERRETRTLSLDLSYADTPSTAHPSPRSSLLDATSTAANIASLVPNPQSPTRSPSDFSQIIQRFNRYRELPPLPLHATNQKPSPAPLNTMKPRSLRRVAVTAN